MFSLILHGRRSLELHRWRNWRASMVSLVHITSDFSNSFSSAATTSDVSHEEDPKGKRFTVSYLVDSLGLTTQLAESISRDIIFEDKRNPDSVLTLLRSYGFTDFQISSIITTYPRLLIANAERSLRPKLQFLQSSGASSSELAEIVTKVPTILGKKGEKRISRYYDYVKDILQDHEADHKSSTFCDSRPRTNRIRNVSVLRELGVPHGLLFDFLISKGQSVDGNERFEGSIKKIVEMGFDPTSPKFVNALYVFYELSDKTIEQKVDAYKRLGLSVDEIWANFMKWPYSLRYSEKKITQTFETLKGCGLTEDEVQFVLKKYPQCIRSSEQKIVNSLETFLELGFTKEEFIMIIKRHPRCIGLAADTLKKTTEFLVKMGWTLEVIASTPMVVGFNLENWILPRCNVIKALISKGLIGAEGELPPISSALTSTKKKFLNLFVMKHGELVPELQSIFNGDCNSVDMKASRTTSKVKDRLLCCDH